MSLGKKLSQYGNLMVALLITVGFGATFLVYGGGAGGTGGNTGNQDREERNLTAPSQTYIEGGFDKSFTEQVVIGARDNKVFVNAYYDNESQIKDLRRLKQLQQDFGGHVFIQVLSSREGSEIVSRNGITEFPTVVVQGGVNTRRGLVPRQQTVENVSVRNVEYAVCQTLSDLGGVAARCQQIGAL